MSASNESKGPAILFLGTWYVLAHISPFEDHPFVAAMLLMAVGWGALKLLGRAVFRLGYHAWYLILQLVVWFGLFLAFAPLDPTLSFLILWGAALPLVMISMGCRYLVDRFPALRKVLDDALRGIALCAFAVLAVCIFVQCGKVLTAIFGALAICVLASIPLYLGWQLGKQPPRGPHDARFGSSDDFHKAGMSDER